ncbi:hypothetical protein L596_023359 [Steinernema carpocapsae]|uniref:CHK kinase-like domain-containing protein n=1 Tax=Steinernema carpocapsae TaxID=34508 RepID=A0A4U5MDF2_STECR|nr:hypothetical protein L596_023359 [Steinernema carpocapsae]
MRVSESIDTSQLIGDSPFSIDWVLKALGEKDDVFQKLSDSHTITKFVTDDVGKGNGYISVVLKIAIGFENVEKPHQVILKLPGADVINGAMSDNNVTSGFQVTEAMIAEVHNRECDFYQKFAPNVKIPVPKIYALVKYDIEKKQRGVLLMENLSDRAAFISADKSLNEEQLMNLATHLAELHSYSLSLPKEEWKGKYFPEVYDWFAENHFYEPCFKTLRKWKPGVFDEAIEKLGNYGNNNDFIRYTTFGVHKELGLPAVLCHGDLWYMNVFWKKNQDGSFTNEVEGFIDWQVIHEGCLTYDIALMMILSTDGPKRREIEWKVVRFYYDTLVKLTEEKGGKVEFTFEQVEKAYKTNFIKKTLNIMMMAPFLYPNTDFGEASEEREKCEIVLERAKYAMEDALEYFKELPMERFD